MACRFVPFPEMSTRREEVIVISGLVMKKANAAEDHRHAVFVTGSDDIFITIGAAGLQDVLHTAFGSTVN